MVETSEEAGKLESISKRDLDTFRKDAGERIERFENEIRRLQRVIEEKETVEKVVGMKVERIRKEKDEEIQRQKALIDRQKADAEALMNNKNDEVDQLQAKF
jgi:predicted RNase H-like nuclease (RuvC/YqgF family)